MKKGAQVLPAQHPKSPPRQPQMESAEQSAGKGSFPKGQLNAALLTGGSANPLPLLETSSKLEVPGKARTRARLSVLKAPTVGNVPALTPWPGLPTQPATALPRPPPLGTSPWLPTAKTRGGGGGRTPSVPLNTRGSGVHPGHAAPRRNSFPIPAF